MKIGCYVRCSTEHQSLDLQIKTLTDYCSARGWNQIEFYEDHGVSGGKLDRPALNRLLKDAKMRKLDCVVATKLDRLFRSVRDMLNTIAELEAVGVKLVVVQDQIDLTTPAGRMMMQMLGVIAEFERELIRGRIKAGGEAARKKKGSWGPKITLDHAMIRKLRREGLSMNAIARRLDCSPGAVHKVLKAS